MKKKTAQENKKWKPKWKWIESITIDLKTGQDELSKVSTDVLSKFATDMLTKEKGTRYGFTEPRIMERACYIGILAQHLGKNEIVEGLKEKIGEFQSAYEAQWFSDVPESQEMTSPRRDQLKVEIMKLRDKVSDSDRNQFAGILDTSEDRVIAEIEIIDVDRFTLYVWGFFQADSPLEQELGI